MSVVSPLVVLAGFWLPGLAIGAAIRLRGWTLAAAAPALTFGAVSVGTLVIGNLGLRWTVASFALWTLVVTALCFGVSLLLSRRPRPPAGRAVERPAEEDAPRLAVREHVLVAAGVVAGIAVGAVTFLRGIGGLGTINQDWDAPFHANAIRWIAEHGNPLPSALAPIAAARTDGAPYFYPNTYHSLMALLFDKGGLAMPELLNLGALAIIVCWPLGIAALGLAWRLPPVGAAVAAAVSTWFTAFPYDSLWRGPLWPFVAGVALVPATLAIARHVVVPRGLAGPIGMALAIAGLVGLHTSLAFVLFGYALVLVAALVLRLQPVRWRSAWPTMAFTVLATVAALVPMLLPSLSSSGVTGARWPQIATPVEAFGQAILFSPVTPFPQWFLGGAAIVGIVLMILHRRMLWLVGAYFGLAVAYASCASLDNTLVNALSGPFYNDSWRLAALLPLAGAIAVGEFGWTVTNTVNIVSSRAGARLSERLASFAVPVAAAVALVAVLGVLGNGAYVGRNEHRLGVQHRDGPTVSSDEIAAYRWIAEQGETGRVMNDWFDGSVWMYALTGLEPVEWTFFGSPEDTASALLSTRLNRLGEDSEVDEALAELDVHYVVIGTGFVRPEGRRAPGLVDLSGVPGLRRVYANQNAAVYEVLADRPTATTSGG